MSAAMLAVVVKPRFMDRLFDIQQYQGRDNEARGREFVAALFDFIYDIIGAQPLAFPVYMLPQRPDLPLRRTTFRRQHILLYEVTATEIILLTIFSASWNAANVSL